MQNFKYFNPVSIEDACKIISSLGSDFKFLSGGTELIPKMKRGVIKPSALINLKDIASLRDVSLGGTNIKVGASTSLHKISISPILKIEATCLYESAGSVASPNIRHAATLGGNICQGPKCLYYLNRSFWKLPRCYIDGGNKCNYHEQSRYCLAISPVDTAPALLALGARLEICSPTGNKIVPAEHFFTNAGSTILKSQEILTAAIFNRSVPGSGSAYVKYSFRKTIDYALACIAVYFEINPKTSCCQRVRIAIGAVDAVPLRAKEAEEILEGRQAEEKTFFEAADVAAISLHSRRDLHASSSFRRKIIRELTKQALYKARARAVGKGETNHET